VRPLVGDELVRLARVLAAVEPAGRRAALDAVLVRARAADAWRQRTGRLHPAWGDGSVHGAVQGMPAAAADARDPDYLGALALAAGVLAARRRAHLARRGGGTAALS
jgi:hypothetical protein